MGKDKLLRLTFFLSMEELRKTQDNILRYVRARPCTAPQCCSDLESIVTTKLTNLAGSCCLQLSLGLNPLRSTQYLQQELGVLIEFGFHGTISGTPKKYCINRNNIIQSTSTSTLCFSPSTSPNSCLLWLILTRLL